MIFLCWGISGTNLTQRFCDQFIPMMVGQNMSWSSSDATIIRMPLSSECLKDGLEIGLKRIKQITDRFLEHASRTLLFLKSVVQVWTVPLIMKVLHVCSCWYNIKCLDISRIYFFFKKEKWGIFNWELDKDAIANISSLSGISNYLFILLKMLLLRSYKPEHL